MPSPDSDDASKLLTLWEIEMIKQLKARYFRTLDTRDWDGFRACFSDDCAFEADGITERNYSVTDFVDWAAGRLLPGTSVHHGHMPEITISGPTEAAGIWAMFDYVENHDQEGLRTRAIQGYGHYFERYRKLPDHGWVICAWRLQRMRVDSL